MANPIYEFREWLLKRRFFRVAWFAKDPKTQPDTDAALVKLPKALANQLIEAANQLSVPEQERSVILEAIHGAIAKWKANPDVSENSIVVLGSPVSSVSRLLAESLPQLDLAVSDEHDEEKDSPLSVHLLDWVERPPEVKAIRDQIQDKLGLPQRMDEPQLNEALDDSPSSTADAEAQQSHPEDEATTAQHLMIIPNLCWCFLRSAEGLDGLDYLQDWLPQDSRQFWVMGSGQVGWEYLNATLMFGAYCGSTINLPSLSGEDLQQWLWPLVERFDVEFVDRALHKALQHPHSLTDSLTDVSLIIDHPAEAVSQITDDLSATTKSSFRTLKDKLTPEESDNTSEQDLAHDYFNRLANVSDGVGVVAMQLFLKSLRCQSEKDKESGKHREQSTAGEPSKNISSDLENSPPRLVATLPKRPPLPELHQDDLYLLYSLLLHGDMTVLALAKSLGDSPQVVNNRVQILRNTGLIEQKAKVLKVNPAHYPALRRELARNNFMIQVP